VIGGDRILDDITPQTPANAGHRRKAGKKAMILTYI